MGTYHTGPRSMRYANVGCDQPSVILLEQASNGIHWLVAADNVADRRIVEDCRTLEAGQHNLAIVFQAHPRLYGIPWRVSDSVANPHVHLALKKQPFKRFKGSQAALSPLLMKLRVAARRSAWKTAVLQQKPVTLWARKYAHGISGMGQLGRQLCN
uniref:RxLR effector candidate protein n=1 Tax=Hyaloperonospora arabidopsidis (strain Emoy2) TaxID=559515 RepID=M4BZI6_HYAAE